MNILICEDHALIAMDLAEMVSAHGHTVEDIVACSTDCLDRCSENRPDLVLTDLNLADGPTGLGLVENLAEQGIPTVIVSSDAGSVPPTTSAKAVVGKPVHEIDLILAIERLNRA